MEINNPASPADNFAFAFKRLRVRDQLGTLAGQLLAGGERTVTSATQRHGDVLHSTASHD